MLFQATLFVVICSSISRKLVTSLTMGSTLTPSVVGQIPMVWHLVGYDGKSTESSCDLPAKDGWLESSRDDTSDKVKLRDILQNNWSVVFKNVKLWKSRKDWRDVPTECRTWFWSGSFRCLGRRRDSWPNLNGVSGEDGSSTSMLVPCFEGCMLAGLENILSGTHKTVFRDDVARAW